MMMSDSSGLFGSFSNFQRILAEQNYDVETAIQILEHELNDEPNKTQLIAQIRGIRVEDLFQF